MTRTIRSPKLSLPRRLALCLACVFLWMGTAGVIDHTDTLSQAGAGLVQASVHHATVPLPADACAACQWTQGVLSSIVAAVSYATPLLTLALLLVSAFATLCLPPSHRRSPRAPPLCLSF